MTSPDAEALVRALEQNDAAAVRTLLDRGMAADLDLANGYSPLMLAVGKGRRAIAQALLDHGAAPDLGNHRGDTALKLACLKEDAAMVDLLLERGAAPNLVDDSGFTPLMYAAMNGKQAVARLLLAAGADPGLRSRKGGNTAADFARKAGKEELAEMLNAAAGSAGGAQAPQAPDKGGHDRAEPIDPDQLVGQRAAKGRLQEIIALGRVNQERARRGLPRLDVSLHAAFIGSPGTGKTTFARYYAQEIKKLGILQRGQLVEATRKDLVAEYAGQTAAKTEKLVQSALGGILFIDEAYALKNGRDDAFGQEAIDALISLIEDHRDRFVLILAGYTEEMREFLHANPGLKSRVPNLVEFEDYSPEELGAILRVFLERFQLRARDEVLDHAIREVLRRKKERSFGNAREVRNVLERALSQQSLRLAGGGMEGLDAAALSTLIHADFTPDPDDRDELPKGPAPGEALAANAAFVRLDELIGLGAVKREIKDLANFLRVSRLRGAGPPELNLHMVFSGNPGTGKTTVARLLGEILRELEFLSSGHLVEAERSALVAPYVGQTAIRTKELIERALGGLLFIDEAYTLFRGQAGGDSFGQEAIDTLLKYMEDHRGRFVVILAGYPVEMEVFLSSNPGLRSRFNTTLVFEDYTAEELLRIAELTAGKSGFHLARDARELLRGRIDAARTGEAGSFGNARFVRNELESAYKRHASRLVGSGTLEGLGEEEMNLLRGEDFQAEELAHAPALAEVNLPCRPPCPAVFPRNR